MISELLEGVSSITEAMQILSREGVSPDYGPYSFSRMDGGCDFKFKKSYIEREDGLKITRFGTNIGSAMHLVSEYDVQLRMADRDVAIEDIVDRVLEEHPECEDDRGDLEDMAHLFREKFYINADKYVASEQHLALDFDMNYVDYDSDKAWFRGKIDYLEINNNVARCVDFKTYPRVHSESEINEVKRGVGRQLMGYLAMVMAFDPRIESGYYEVYYFRFGASRESSRKTDGGVWLRRYISREEVERWWKLNQRKMLAFERKTEWQATPSQKACQYCPFLDICPERLRATEFIARNDREVEELSNRLTVIDEERNRLKSAVNSYIDDAGANVRLSNGKVIGHVPRKTYDIDVQEVVRICNEDGFDLTPYITISKTNFEKIKKALGEEKLNGAITEKTVTRRTTH